MKRLTLTAGVCAALLSCSAVASSHREALNTAAAPQTDNTDVYAFNSYEAGRSGYVTLIANFVPFQDPGGGPHFYPLDPQAIYSINIDNDGDARPDVTFAFDFANSFKNLALNVGGMSVPIPILNAAPIGPTENDTAALDRTESYSLTVWRDGNPRGEAVSPVAGSVTDGFRKPVDNIGNKSIGDYEAYARRHIYQAALNGCSGLAKVFVGQRKEGFVVNVGEAFDLVNLNPLGAPDAKPNSLAGKNITTIALEVPASCLTAGTDPVIGVWSTVSRGQITVRGEEGGAVDRGGQRQVSRLGMPLVNELVIGNPDKNTFNTSTPDGDGQFLRYVTNPVLPELLETLFPVRAPNVFPRTDLVTVFLTGVPGVNKPANGVPSEMLRLNTTTPTVAAADQDPLGVLGGDSAGYPNGRRPGDDVVDISLRVAMGALLTAEQAPDGQLPYTDQAYIDATMFDNAFPYLKSPLPGSPATASVP